MPAVPEVLRDADRLWRRPRNLPGIDLREVAQLTLLEEFAAYYKTLPFPEHQLPPRRYHLSNTVFSYADGITLYCMLRHAKPRRIIEVGSGYSSAAMLDTNELFFDNAITMIFIEPYPDRLLSLMRPEDRTRTTILAQRVQDVPLETFATLGPSDILFIDSTHVAKIGSDVNYLWGEVVPSLAIGVYVHVHDVPYPFEYFRDWVGRRIAWNEAYLVRAFLTFNRAYEVVFFNTFLEHFHRAWFAQHMPLCLNNTGGSLWLRRVAA